MNRIYFNWARACVAMAVMAGCTPGGGFDPDLRGLIPGGLDTADAASRAAPRPQPDSRGLITFANGQAVVARPGDTPATIGTRLGIRADALARHNALPVTAALNDGAVLVLPTRVAAGPAAAPSGGAVTDPFANQKTPQPTSAASKPTVAASAARPSQHVVADGETAWSIARKYGVSVKDLADWNGLPETMSVRKGQRLLVPAAGKAPPATIVAATTAPGTGSPTPRPPSAADPLPDEKTAAANTATPAKPVTDLGATRTAASGTGKFRMPVSGSIIRVYEKGKNDGIDIAATSGAKVGAAGGGTVAAITRDTAGVPIVVVRHADNLLTVYTGLDTLDVTKGQSVSAGQTLGQAGDSGVVHFEVRKGFESTDPEDFLG